MRPVRAQEPEPQWAEAHKLVEGQPEVAVGTPAEELVRNQVVAAVAVGERPAAAVAAAEAHLVEGDAAEHRADPAVIQEAFELPEALARREEVLLHLV